MQNLKADMATGSPLVTGFWLLAVSRKLESREHMDVHWLLAGLWLDSDWILTEFESDWIPLGYRF